MRREDRARNERSGCFRVLALTPIVLVLGASPLRAQEEVYTGRELLADCRRTATPGADSACQRWVDWAMSNSYYYCLPADISDGALRTALVGWFETHSPKLHMPGGWLVQNALVEIYPCAKP
jgi:hypothetical protein